MLKCKEVVETADALVDGTPLSWRERFALRVHLLMCHHCRRYVRQLHTLVTSLNGKNAPPASDEQVQSILDKLDHEH